MSGEESREKLDDWKDWVKTTVLNLEELVIVTKVGDSELRSSIHLITGDITTDVAPIFTQPEYAELWDYHQAQVASGRDIIRTNVENLKKLVDAVADLFPEGE